MKHAIKATVGLTAAGMLLLTTALPAGAQPAKEFSTSSSHNPIPVGKRLTDKPAPKWVPQSLWNDLVGRTPKKWRPKGELIADTGFRPQKDGLFFLNYSNSGHPRSAGFPNQVNHYIFGTSLGQVANMDSRDMIGLFGSDDVCAAKPEKSGRCALTVAARQWMDYSNQASNGGHCFGIAALVGQVFSGMVDAQSLGARKVVKAPFASKVTRPVAQRFATQEYLSPPTLTAAKAVPRLVKSMQRETGMFTLALSINDGGGHAITPLAVYDRGKGKYDIAVYDNNYPERVRAIHADTKAKVTSTYAGFDYQVQANPGSPPSMLAGGIELYPVAESMPTENAPCPFCPGTKATRIRLDPVVTDTPVEVRVTSPDGSAIPGLRVKHPTSPWRPGQPQAFPTFVVPAEAPFTVVVDNGANPSAVETGMLAAIAAGLGRKAIGSAALELSDWTLPAGSSDGFTFDPTGGEIAFRSSGGSDPKLTILDTATNAAGPGEFAGSWQPASSTPGGGFVADLDAAAQTMLFAPEGASETIETGVLIQAEDGQTAMKNAGQAPLKVPSGGAIRWSYTASQVTSSSQSVDLLDRSGAVESTVAIPTQTTKVAVS